MPRIIMTYRSDGIYQYRIPEVLWSENGEKSNQNQEIWRWPMKENVGALLNSGTAQCQGSIEKCPKSNKCATKIEYENILKVRVSNSYWEKWLYMKYI